MPTRLLLPLLLLGATLAAQSPPPPAFRVLENGFVYDTAAFASCHAPTLAELADGRTMAAWFGGSGEGNDDISIYYSIRTDTTWSPPALAADGTTEDGHRYPTWNPVLFRNAAGTLFLYYKVGPTPFSWWGVYRTWDAARERWSDRTVLPTGILGPIKNKPILLADGSIVSPSSVESDSGRVWRAHVERSTDHGATWTLHPVPAPDSMKLIQPTVLRLGGDSLRVLLRSNQNVIVESTSADGGRHWSPARPTAVRNPNSGVDALNLAGGGYLLVYNPTVSGVHWSEGRNRLNLAYSADGTEWQDVLELENEPSGAFSYPAIIQDATGTIHVAYTWQRERIRYLRLRRE